MLPLLSHLRLFARGLDHAETLFSASPRPIFNFFVWTPMASYGAIRQTESGTLMANYDTERVKID